MKYRDSRNTKTLSEFDEMPKQLCKECQNVIKMAGQAFTKYECDICKKILLHPNTATPKLCEKCGLEHGLCRDCKKKL